MTVGINQHSAPDAVAFFWHNIMVKVSLSGTVLADSDDTITVEGNHYFPPDAVNAAALTPSTTHTTCPYKGVASYYNATLNGKTVVNDVAWYYPEPKEAANAIGGYVAFYKSKVDIDE
ncbi:hypothetical protein A0H81_08646 [Grifola frondosa]|uniref:DUF427 domain-containing protein n=1 Tax=Grifola frondosa TaxID=5627 RepID=A0A1C7M435_GRIFR|nr:hypothetical protein A0H81_08646 [Grifola frondosa]